jgi:hypothetical protein
MASIKREWVRLVKDEPKYEGPPPDCIIYFVQCQQTKYVKIGYAKDPWGRPALTKAALNPQTAWCNSRAVSVYTHFAG